MCDVIHILAAGQPGTWVGFTYQVAASNWSLLRSEQGSRSRHVLGCPAADPPGPKWQQERKWMM